MYKVKKHILKEIIKPAEVNPNFLSKLEKKYGPVDMENDFFSKDLSTYFKNTSQDPKTKSSEHKVIELESFGKSFKALYTALVEMVRVSRTNIGKKDEEIRKIADQTKNLFNQYRTHLRKNYNDQYNQFKDKLMEEFLTGSGLQTATPKAFSKLKEDKEKDAFKLFQDQRIMAFDTIEEKLNLISTSLANKKNETSDFYSSNPGSFDVLYPTDLILDYLKDIEKLLK